jgi:hypothetical protein
MSMINMEQDFKQEVQELKTTIDTLSNNIEQKFSILNEVLSSSFGQISQQITNLSGQQSSIITMSETNVNNDYKSNLSKPQQISKIPNEYFIDYLYIDKKQYSSWLENLRRYNKEMAECRQKQQIQTFCQSANTIIDSAIKVLFKEEYNSLCEINTEFIEAYERVKNQKEKKGWKIIEICVNTNSTIQSKDFKNVKNKYYISWQAIEELNNRDFNSCLEIFFETIKKNFLNNLNPKDNLKENFFLIKNMHQLRNLKTHGSKDDLKTQLNEKGSYIERLYYDSDNYKKITEVVSWFVKEVYQRIEKLKKYN